KLAIGYRSELLRRASLRRRTENTLSAPAEHDAAVVPASAGQFAQEQDRGCGRRAAADRDLFDRVVARRGVRDRLSIGGEHRHESPGGIDAGDTSHAAIVHRSDVQLSACW